MGIKDTDKGWSNLEALVRHLSRDKLSVVAGLTGPAATAAHAGGDGMTVVEIGAVHEYGAGVPRRSFIRDTVAKKEAAYARATADAAKSIMAESMSDRALANNPAASRHLKRLALRLEGDIKQRIADGIDPANAPSTIAAKGSSKPLIDKGQLRAAVTSQVRRNGKAAT